MLYYYSLKLFVDLELFKLVGSWICSLGRRLERKSSLYEVYLVLHDVKNAKSAGPEVIVFPKHLENFPMVCLVNTKSDVICVDVFIGVVERGFYGFG